jgi:hypothetical protein
MITLSEMFTKLAAAIANDKNPPFDFAVVDEAQDMGVAHLRFVVSTQGGEWQRLPPANSGPCHNRHFVLGFFAQVAFLLLIMSLIGNVHRRRLSK